MREINDDENIAARAVAGRVCLEIGRVDDGEFGLMVFDAARRAGTYEHVAREQAVPGLRVNDLNGHAIGGVGADKQILCENFACFQEFEYACLQRVELFGGKRLVDGAPANAVFGRCVAYDEFIVGRAPRMHTGAGDKCAVCRQNGFLALQRMFVKIGRG